jgi:ribonuclease HI
MAKKTKYYVIWAGHQPGVYDNWDEAKKQVEGYNGAKYKSYESKIEAESVFKDKPEKHIYGNKTAEKPKKLFEVGKPIADSFVVDAAFSSATNAMEYQGIYLADKKKIFHQGPFADGTNNIGEFLAIVHALAFLQKHNLSIPIYSDSRTAIAWVKRKTANTKLVETKQNKTLFEMMERAEKWLKENNYKNPILKWETDFWGENPADFGRK